jgi:hypothetical protein
MKPIRPIRELSRVEVAGVGAGPDRDGRAPTNWFTYRRAYQRLNNLRTSGLPRRFRPRLSGRDPAAVAIGGVLGVFSRMGRG